MVSPHHKQILQRTINWFRWQFTESVSIRKVQSPSRCHRLQTCQRRLWRLLSLQPSRFSPKAHPRCSHVSSVSMRRTFGRVLRRNWRRDVSNDGHHQIDHCTIGSRKVKVKTITSFSMASTRHRSARTISLDATTETCAEPTAIKDKSPNVVMTSFASNTMTTTWPTASTAMRQPTKNSPNPTTAMTKRAIRDLTNAILNANRIVSEIIHPTQDSKRKR